MTNKLPVVDRKYQIGDSFVSKYPNGFKDIYRIISLTECPDQPYIFKGDDSLYGYWQSEKYIDEHYDWRDFEELPEDNLQETEKATIIFQNPDEPSLGFNSSTWSDVGTDSVDLEKGKVNKIEKALEAEKKVTQEHYDLEAVTRLEIIDSNGRSYVNLHANPMKFSYQDDGKTLKIFCGNKEDMSKPEPKIDMKEERVDPVNVERALEKLKECAKPINYMNWRTSIDYEELKEAAQNLVEALESEKKSRALETNKILKPKIDIKEECVDPVNIRKETYRCAHDYVLKNQGYNNSDHLIREYECSICGENKMTIQS